MAWIFCPLGLEHQTAMTAFFVCTAVLGPSIPIANADQMDLEKAASHIAAKIVEKGRTTVIVADFLGPRDQVNELGRDLADQFSAALAKANPSLKILPRAGQAATVETQFGESMERREGSGARELGRFAQTEVVVAGTLQPHSDWVDLHLRAWDVPPGNRENFDISEAHKLDELNVRTPLTKEKKVLLDRLLALAPQDGFTLAAGRKAPQNASVPQCLDCPSPRPFLKSAFVILRITVSVRGRVTAIEVLKAADPKTTEAAVQTVRKWRFKPASGPNGIPIESRTEVQLNMREEPL